MTKRELRLKSLKYILIASISTVLISVFIVNPLNTYFAKQGLREEAEELSFQLTDSITQAKRIFDQLSREGFECNSPAEQYLIDLIFDVQNIRWLGVSYEDELRCQTTNINLDWSLYNEHKLSDNFAIASTYHHQSRMDLIFIKSDDKWTFYADLSPFYINYLDGFHCTECIEYTMKTTGPRPIKYKSPPVRGPIRVTETTNLRLNGVDIRFEIKGNTQLFNHYRVNSWASALLLALMISSIAAVGFASLMNRRQSFEHILNEAIQNKEFVPYYQPIFNTSINKVVGAEVLVRWVRPDGSIVPPAQFIDFAESTGYIIPITELLIEQVVSDLGALSWDKTDRYASINLVPKHLESDDLLRFCLSVLDTKSISMKHLSFEITERHKISDLKKARNVIEGLTQYGATLKLDDAGTGYGGFSYVQELGISSLKIDKMFIDTITNKDDVKRPVLDAIISFAKSSNLEIVAEGVEKREQVQYLSRKGVDIIQGYFFSKPLPFSDFKKMMLQLAKQIIHDLPQ